MTASLGLVESVGTGANLSTSNSSTLLLKLFKPLATIFDLLISNLLVSDFRLAKSSFLANCNLSTPVAFLSEANLIELIFCFYYDYKMEITHFA